MSHTVVEKILGAHAGREVFPDEIVDVEIDARVARDFGGANVVKNLREHRLDVADPTRTFFTFDCNPTGSDQKYAANQQICRLFAREQGVGLFDIDRGIGTHLAIDNGLVGPGGTLVSTDSHANILGAIGAFGQGMGDVDIAHAFAHGRIWFKVPPTVQVEFVGTPSPLATPKDLVLAALRLFGANGLLGYSAEFTGEAIERLSLDGRITVSSMATEMGGIIALIPPSHQVIDHCRRASARFEPVFADEDARYARTVQVDVEGLLPLLSRPGHPEDVVEVAEVAGQPIDSAFVGSCTNGRMEDLRAVARLLQEHKLAPGVVLKIVPATDRIWRQCLDEGLIEVFKRAGAMVGNAGCAGCAAGQIGQTGPGEVAVSTGNRNFAGKQGKGLMYLASPATAASSAIAGAITTVDALDIAPQRVSRPVPQRIDQAPETGSGVAAKPTRMTGRVWVVDKDNIDTDMIYHNRHLAVTDLLEMGQFTFGNLPGWEQFPQEAQPGDILVVGQNFGCGSSRQQAVDCFKALEVGLIVGRSFGAIYERNAINNALPILVADLVHSGIKDGDQIEVDLTTGEIRLPDGRLLAGQPFSEVQMAIYQKGGLL
ncbi:MAG: 3-isopropylmalate dehydratase large subunit [Bradymonadales bacterium]|nr:3-isopropylmalate dehydratase large subunit [Bradymonadales bacterium]